MRRSYCITPGCDLHGGRHPALLRPVPRPGVSDDTLDCWDWVDEYGRTTFDRRPSELSDDPKGWWASLARDHIEVYSSLSAAIRLGHWSWRHHHYPGPSIVTEGFDALRLPPMCHDQPMFAGVEGWACRARRRVVAYVL